MGKATYGYMARKNNAIGIFYPVSTTVDSSRPEGKSLKDQAFDKLHELGYETLHPIGVYPDGKPPAHVMANPNSEHVE